MSLPGTCAHVEHAVWACAADGRHPIRTKRHVFRTEDRLFTLHHVERAPWGCAADRRHAIRTIRHVLCAHGAAGGHACICHVHHPGARRGIAHVPARRVGHATAALFTVRAITASRAWTTAWSSQCWFRHGALYVLAVGRVL